MKLDVVLIGLALSAVVMFSRMAPFALLAGRNIHPRLRKLIEIMPGCAIAGFMTTWALPGESESVIDKLPLWLGGLTAMAICLPTGRLLLGMVAGLSVAALGSLAL